MPYGAFQRCKSARQLWQRPINHSPKLGTGGASLVLGSDTFDEGTRVTLRAGPIFSGSRIEVSTTGDVNDAKVLEYRGHIRLNEPPPAGYEWRLYFTVGGDVTNYAFTSTQFNVPSLNYPIDVSLDDVVQNVAGLGAGVTLEVGLTFEVDVLAPGIAGVDVDVLLPSVYIDQILAPETVANDLIVTNRFPVPNQESVPEDFNVISFRLVDVAGTGVDTAATTVTVDGVTVYTAGAFVGPWAGFVVPGLGPTGNDVDFFLTVPPSELPWDSEQAVQINVISSLTGGLSPVNDTWTFITADTLKPALQRANMISKNTVRVQFTDDLLLDDSFHGALNPANYTTVRVSAPAVTLDVVSVSPVAALTDTVDVTFNWEATQGADYSLVVRNIKDDGGNIIDPVGAELRFKGYIPPRPAGRRFELLDFIPDMNIAEDRTVAQGADPTNPGTGDLRKFMLVLQDVADLLLCQIDRWTEIFDIDLAEEQFLDAILQDLGNPFIECIADLDLAAKRRLARILISIYKEKGTEQGVINAIRFFLGIEVTLDIINCRQFWQLNVSLLGQDTFLAPGVGSPLWYSFYIVSPVVLDDEQRERILCIADYMKAAHEHILGIIEPGGQITLSEFWILNVSLLGVSTILAP